MTPRPAATVMVVRDAPRGIETFMLERRHDMAFAPGAYVFPGGALDDEDHFDDISERCEGLGEAAASNRLGVDQGGLAYWIAAIREAFEEVGVLFAADHTGTQLRMDHDGHAARFREHRLDVDRGATRLAEVCRSEGIRLTPGEIRYFGRWITPELSPKRYDTRFFVARVPEGQTLAHEETESRSGQWVRPADALAQHAADSWQLILPTMRSLELLCRFDRVGSLLDALDPVQTGAVDGTARVIPDSGGWRVELPGDAAAEAVPAQQGPHR